MTVRGIAVGPNLGIANTIGATGNPTITLTDVELLAIAGLTSAADRLPYFTGSGTAALATFTAFARTLLDDADQVTARATLGAAPLDSPVFTTAITVPDGSISFAEIQNVSATDRLLGRDTALAGVIEELTVTGGLEFTGAGGIQRSALTGDVTATAGSNVTAIAAGAVTNAMLANVTAATVKGGPVGAGGAAPVDLTATQLNAIVGSTALSMADAELIRPKLRDYSETAPTPTISANAATADFEAGNIAVISLTADLTTLTISNPPTSGDVGALTIWLVQDATGGRTVTWPAAVDWGTAGVPTIAGGANEETVITLLTRNAGTSYKGILGWAES